MRKKMMIHPITPRLLLLVVNYLAALTTHREVVLGGRVSLISTCIIVSLQAIITEHCTSFSRRWVKSLSSFGNRNGSSERFSFAHSFSWTLYKVERKGGKKSLFFDIHACIRRLQNAELHIQSYLSPIQLHCESMFSSHRSWWWWWRHAETVMELRTNKNTQLNK